MVLFMNVVRNFEGVRTHPLYTALLYTHFVSPSRSRHKLAGGRMI